MQGWLAYTGCSFSATVVVLALLIGYVEHPILTYIKQDVISGFSEWKSTRATNSKASTTTAGQSSQQGSEEVGGTTKKNGADATAAPTAAAPPKSTVAAAPPLPDVTTSASPVPPEHHPPAVPPRPDASLSLESSIHPEAWAVLARHDPERPEGLERTLPDIDMVFVIHAPFLQGRRIRLEQELDRVGLKNATTWVTWLNREDYESMTPNARRSLVSSSRWRMNMTGGTISLALKHLWVYFYTWRHNLQHVVVMEDDGAFDSQHLLIQLNLLQLDVPTDYMMVQLGGCFNRHADARWNHFGRLNKVTDHLYGPGYDSRCTSGYMVSARGAEAMLRHIFSPWCNGSTPVDWDLDERCYGILRHSDHEQNFVVHLGGYWHDPYLWAQTNAGGKSHGAGCTQCHSADKPM